MRENRILVTKFDYMDPPIPLSVDGLEKIAATLERLLPPPPIRVFDVGAGTG